METIPNHTMMMTGVRPDRIQVPANAIYDRAAGAVRTLDRPDDLRFPTVLERLRRIGLTTGTVLSNDYLYGGSARVRPGVSTARRRRWTWRRRSARCSAWAPRGAGTTGARGCDRPARP